MPIGRFIAALTLLIVLAGCAGPNGVAQGSEHGGTAHTDIFRLPFPP